MVPHLDGWREQNILAKKNLHHMLSSYSDVFDLELVIKEFLSLFH